MKIYRIHEPAYESDYQSVAKNGFAYTNEMAGYYDILKKGYPKPKDESVVLAELRSLEISDTLWSTGAAVWISVQFLVSDEIRLLFQEEGFSGLKFRKVEITKIATKGKKKINETGEPEDLISKSKGIQVSVKPTLWAVEVTGQCMVQPESEKLKDDIYILPYKFPEEPHDDFFLPVFQQKRYGGSCFVTEKTQKRIQDLGVRNVDFSLFQDGGINA